MTFANSFLTTRSGSVTSLDGPEQVNDRQRGPGYFKKTMEGIHLLHKHGMNTGCIAAFTSHSAAKVNEVFEFFLKNTLSFSVHCAVKPIQYNGDQKLFLSAEGFERVLIQLLDLYLENANKIRISTLDDMIQKHCQGEIRAVLRFPGVLAIILPFLRKVGFIPVIVLQV